MASNGSHSCAPGPPTCHLYQVKMRCFGSIVSPTSDKLQVELQSFDVGTEQTGVTHVNHQRCQRVSLCPLPLCGSELTTLRPSSMLLPLPRRWNPKREFVAFFLKPRVADSNKQLGSRKQDFLKLKKQLAYPMGGSDRPSNGSTYKGAGVLQG